MTVLDIVGLYYDAWANRKGDFSGVPLAAGFMFRGPVACSTTLRATGRWLRRLARW